MRAYEEDVTVERDGVVAIGELPVKAGDRVRIIVLLPDENHPEGEQYPLRGKQPYRYDNPTEPVSPEDWEANE